MASESEHTVLLIHGTFAASADDRGAAWWQRDSDDWNALQQKLPSNVTLLPEPEGLFHWSGQNTEWEREKAARELLDLLENEYEIDDRPYHLIGHSHGGSVIWNALVRATQAGRELRNLKSWATVGTPFMQYVPAPSARRWEWCFLGGAALAFVLTFLLLGLALFLILWGIHHYTGWLAPAGAWGPCVVLISGLAYTVAAPLLFLRKLSAKGRHALASREQADAATMRLYGDRWLGIVSSKDEALHGLRHTVGFHAPLLREIRLSGELTFGQFDDEEKVNLADLAARTRGFHLHWLNGLVPKVNDFLCSRVAGFLQGNDWPGAQVASVGPGPIPLDESLAAYPPLDPRVDQALIARANELMVAKMSDLVPMLRDAFGQMVIGKAGVLIELPPEVQQALVHEKLLVHCLYFDNAEVRELLCLHVAEHAQRSLPGAANPWSDPLFRWYRAFKDAVRTNVLNPLG